MIINGEKVPETPDVESFSIRWMGDHSRVRVVFHDGRKRTAVFSGEADTTCEAVALGVNAIVAYACSHNTGGLGKVEARDGEERAE